MSTFFQHKKYILKHCCLLLLVLFALMPCAVKNTLLMGTDIPLVNTLNISKVSGSSAEGCSIYTGEKMQVVYSIRNCSTVFLKKVLYSSRSVYAETLNRSLHYAANAPPLYILYKRLRIAVLF